MWLILREIRLINNVENRINVETSKMPFSFMILIFGDRRFSSYVRVIFGEHVMVIDGSETFVYTRLLSVLFLGLDYLLYIY